MQKMQQLIEDMRDYAGVESILDEASNPVGKAVTKYLKKLDFRFNETSGLISKAIMDIIHIEDRKVQRKVAEVLYNMLELEMKEHRAQMEGLKKQYKL